MISFLNENTTIFFLSRSLRGMSLEKGIETTANQLSFCTISNASSYLYDEWVRISMECHKPALTHTVPLTKKKDEYQTMSRIIINNVTFISKTQMLIDTYPQKKGKISNVFAFNIGLKWYFYRAKKKYGQREVFLWREVVCVGCVCVCSLFVRQMNGQTVKHSLALWFEWMESHVYAFIEWLEKFLFLLYIDLLLVHSIYYEQIIQLHVYIIVLWLARFVLLYAQCWINDHSHIIYKIVFIFILFISLTLSGVHLVKHLLLQIEADLASVEIQATLTHTTCEKAKAFSGIRKQPLKEGNKCLRAVYWSNQERHNGGE